MSIEQTTPSESVPSLTIALPDEAATALLGHALSLLLQPGDLLALRGELGVGKTALARAIIRARLGPDGADEEVPSPTFTLVQTYETPDLLITHVDLYRLDAPEDAAELGLSEALDEGALLMEWPDKLGHLPATRLDIELVAPLTNPMGEITGRETAGSSAREAHLTGRGEWAARLAALKL
jgi:tRNA threonylcarbamoyladenosine biosynthesis protein TsaE